MFYEEEDSWVSEFWFRLFASVLLFSCSYWWVSLSTFRPSSSLNPPSTSCQSSGVPPSTEPQDSERTVGEVVVGETRFPGDDAAAGLVASEVTVAMVVDSSREVAGTSHDVSLICLLHIGRLLPPLLFLLKMWFINLMPLIGC